jgi:hypothetical protein
MIQRVPGVIVLNPISSDFLILPDLRIGMNPHVTGKRYRHVPDQSTKHFNAAASLTFSGFPLPFPQREA